LQVTFSISNGIIEGKLQRLSGLLPVFLGKSGLKIPMGWQPCTTYFIDGPILHFYVETHGRPGADP
jgi:hypothetical protein